MDSPMCLSSSSVLSHMSSHSALTSSISLAKGRRGGGKPTTLASMSVALGVKKGRKKKDPNEPQKPVSAYALFFRDTQAAIKGQNPNASFGEVSKIVASMWDGLGEEQKQVRIDRIGGIIRVENYIYISGLDWPKTGSDTVLHESL